jgi:hypothetical protein
MRIGLGRRRNAIQIWKFFEIDDAIIHAPEGLRPIVLRQICGKFSDRPMILHLQLVRFGAVLALVI